MQTTDFEFIRITAQYPQAGKESNKPEKEIPGWLKTLIIILFIRWYYFSTARVAIDALLSIVSSLFPDPADINILKYIIEIFLENLL